LIAFALGVVEPEHDLAAYEHFELWCPLLVRG